jgi:hypothetical protein
MTTRRPCRRPGRPTKFSTDTALAIAEGVADGLTRDAAAAQAGINGATLRRWLVEARRALALGRTGDDLAALPGFLADAERANSARQSARVEQALAEWKAEHVGRLSSRLGGPPPSRSG